MREIEEMGGRAFAMQGDMTDPEQVRAFVAAAALAYGAAKGAIMTMTRGMAKELAPDIRVNALCPGMIDTDFHNIFTKPETRRMVAGNTPLKREGSPEEVADLAVFLASPAAAFITGANVDINGGTIFS